MTPDEVYCLVSTLPGNATAKIHTNEHERCLRAKFADALTALVPIERRSEEMISCTRLLRLGGAYAGSSARTAVKCGADPLVVVTTARLILS